MPGPLPKPAGQRRRNNPPTIPTTELPHGGYSGAVPRPPSWVALGKAGMAWWRWAWRTPQAAAWSPGDLVSLARRASLEDDMAAIHRVDGLDLSGLPDREEVEGMVRALAALASGRLAVAKECRELDDRFGLTPKAMAALRWQIVADKAEAQQKAPATIRRLQAVDSATG